MLLSVITARVAVSSVHTAWDLQIHWHTSGALLDCQGSQHSSPTVLSTGWCGQVSGAMPEEAGPRALKAGLCLLYSRLPRDVTEGSTEGGDR